MKSAVRKRFDVSLFPDDFGILRYAKRKAMERIRVTTARYTSLCPVLRVTTNTTTAERISMRIQYTSLTWSSTKEEYPASRRKRH